MDYYVDAESGLDDWPGTELQPWRTLIKAGGTLVAGDTAHVMTGSYVGDVRIVNPGQVGQPITFQAAQGQTPVITSGLKGFRLSYADHVVIDGFEITGLIRNQEDQGTAVAGFNSQFCVIRNCSFHNNPRYGILAYGSQGWVVENCIIHDNGGHGIMLHESQAGLKPDDVIIRYCEIRGNGAQIDTADGSGIFIGGAGNHCQIEDNICENNAGNGILLGGTCGHNVIARNRCHGNNWYGVWVSAATTETVAENNIIKWNDCQRNSGGIALSWSRNNDVYRNIIADNAQEPTRIGCGIIFRYSEGDRAWNNVIWGNQFTNSAAGIQIGSWWQGDGEPCSGIVLFNNIVGANVGKRSLQCSLEPGSSLVRENYNDWFGEVAGFIPGPDSINADPLLQDDFRLSPGSPCIGAGIIDANLPESLVDMGVFPYSDQNGCNKLVKLSRLLWR